ncbi:cobaltochelatase subunit CobN [Stenotrophomonas rhizophila]|uniref:cobaltochelatase subunit CobN n=1 Tax=Stenotrophomonas rhizophila TaxID=216778 RepID=UPI001E2B31CF|nr:cobaltochelatase subunit CobN [Stenotrophomonas rhizophila]MCC7635377.1 cobaltochelatase subunit CobN [Stenotrophomonas rhizophila]MCC7664394.1 cobaltochelatase subunit CobN [Stenotrophomonas rhizophila]
MLLAPLSVAAAGLQVEIVTTDFITPAKIAAIDGLVRPAGVQVTQRLVGKGQVLPEAWPAGVDLVIIDSPRPSDAEQIMAAVKPALQAGTAPWVRVGGGAPASGGLQPGHARRIAGYYGNGGEANFQMLGWWLGKWAKAEPDLDSLPTPYVLPPSGYYTGPAQPAYETSRELEDAWTRAGQDAWPRAAVIIAASSVSSMQTQVVDALVAAGRRHKIAVFGVWYDQQAGDGLGQAIGALDVSAVVNLTHLQNGKALAAEFAALDVPVIQALNYRQGNAQQWRDATSGVPMSLMSTFVALPETWGVSDPIVLSAMQDGALQPIPEQVDALAAKLGRLARLRARPAAEKHLALLFWNAPDGEKNLSASHLNVPRSIASLLPKLQAAGYAVKTAEEKQIIADAQALLGGYYRPASLDDLLARGLAVAFPVSRYTRWLEALPGQRRDELTRRWGEAADSPYVRTVQGQPSFVIPRLQLGNLLVMPQPPRAGGVGQATHDLDAVPSHYYLAAYLYLQESWRADALIHFGTHGTQEWTPGKDRGLWAKDYPWLAVGDVPVFYPYIQDNIGEAMQAKRRGRAVIVSHQTPAYAPSGLYDELRDLHQLVHEYQQLDAGQVRQTTAAQLQEMASSSGIASDMGWTPVDMQSRFPAFLQALHDHLHELARRQLPLGLHTFGEPADAELRLLTVMQQLGPAYPAALGMDPTEANTGDAGQIRGGAPYQTLVRYVRDGADLQAVENTDLRAQLARAKTLDAALVDTQEVEALLRGLAGGFVLPGSGGDPIRSPEVRSGRNLYAFEADRIPTRAAFESGRQALDQLLQAYRQEHGTALPEKLAISLWSSEAIRHLGVLEAQVLHAMGLRPRWDEAGKVVALDIVPVADMSHPRIDVVVQATSVYRDQFDPFLRLLADAVVRLGRLPPTATNPVARNTRAMEQKLRDRGVPAGQARALADLRVFSNAPGAFGSGLNRAVLGAGAAAHKDDATLANGFLDSLQYGYDAKGQALTLPDGNLFAEQLRGVQAAVLSRSSNVNGLLGTDHPFEYLGGLALAVRHLDGKTPSLFISDLRQATPKTTTAARFLADELRTGVLNPAWISTMKQEGYAGTLEVLKTTGNLLGWQVTAPGTVRQDQWQAMHDTYVGDVRNQGVAEWFERSNPTAQVQLIQRLQEAIARGYWNPDAQTRAELQQRLDQLSSLTSAAVDPARPTSSRSGGSGFGTTRGKAPAAAAAPDAQAATSQPASPAPAPSVRGRVMRQSNPLPPLPSGHTGLALLAILLLVGLGAWRQAATSTRRPPKRP